MIKNLEKLKEYNIICTNTDEVEECLEILKKLGLKIYDGKIDYRSRIVNYSSYGEFFMSTSIIDKNYKDINFYNFKKQTKKFLKEKQLPDFEVASDGRIIKVNNYSIEKLLFASGYWDNFTPNFSFINKIDIEYLIKLGLVFESKEVRDKAEEKRRIYIQLKNLAEILNKGQKIDWDNKKQKKYFIYYDYNKEKLKEGYNNMCRNEGTIYCVDINFLEIALKEIGEENLLKLFED